MVRYYQSLLAQETYGTQILSTECRTTSHTRRAPVSLALIVCYKTSGTGGLLPLIYVWLCLYKLVMLESHGYRGRGKDEKCLLGKQNDSSSVKPQKETYLATRQLPRHHIHQTDPLSAIFAWSYHSVYAITTTFPFLLLLLFLRSS